MTDRSGAGVPNGSRFATDGLLEAALADLAGALDVPATPDIATAVRLRLTEGRRGARRSRVSLPWPGLRLRPSPLLVLLALVALLVVAGVAAAIGFGLPGLRIIFSEATPSPSTPIATPAAQPTPVGPTSLVTPSATTSAAPGTPAPTEPPTQPPTDLGTPTTLAQARSAVTFPVSVPDALAPTTSQPAVYLDSRVNGGAVVLVYPAGDGLPAPPGGPAGPAGQPIGLIVTESRGSVDQALLGKVLGPGTTITPVQVNGTSGLWITGRPHSLLILDASGQPIEVTLREVGDVLVWVKDGTLLRIESPLDLAATLRIAESMR